MNKPLYAGRTEDGLVSKTARSAATGANKITLKPL